MSKRLTPGQAVDLAMARVTPGVRVPELAAARATSSRPVDPADPRQIGLASPFSTSNHLQAVVWADLTGRPATIMDRSAAMTIPAIARQRHLLAGSVARCPLVKMTKAVREVDQPLWMTRTDGELHPFHRMLWTVDDLMFGGWSLWRATRETRPDALGNLLTAERIPPHRWETESQSGRIKVDGEYVNAGEVILIPGPHEGILNFGAAALRRMVDNLEAAATAARNPSAYLELHYTGDEPLTDDQIDSLTARWAAARRGENGGVAFTGKSIELREHGTHEAHLLIEGRNADSVDASRLVSSPAAMADATNAGASLTYETSEGRNGQFIDYGVGLYMDAVAARLSMDDVVTRGSRTAFDVSELSTITPSPTGPATED